MGVSKLFKYWYFDCCSDFEYTYTFSKHTPCGLSNKLINTFVLPQFEGPQTIPRIEVGSMFPCLRIFFSDINCILSSKLDTLIACDCRTNRIFSFSIHNVIKTDKIISRATYL